jgi:peptidoglycan/xylan/chitin deacetylase (PgdA/CDA1 family)
MFKITSRQLFLKVFTFLALLLLTLGIIVQAYAFTIPVFGFHNIIDENNPQASPSRAANFDYSIQDLETLIRYLIKENYWFLSSQELYDYFLQKSQPIPLSHAQEKPVMLTFDDGYQSLDAYVLPLLRKLQKQSKNPLKVVLFLNPVVIKKDSSKQKVRYLNCADIRRGIEEGFYDIQSHGYNHTILTKLDDTRLDKDLAKSQAYLRECSQGLPKTENVAQHLAYPYNRVDARVKKFASQYYLSGYTFQSRFRDFLFSKSPLRVPRIGVLKQDFPTRLIKLLP